MEPVTAKERLGLLNAACGIEYRLPYNTRLTFISHCLAAGMNPVEVAQMTGHNLRTLLEKYAGLIKATPEAPDLFS